MTTQMQTELKTDYRIPAATRPGFVSLRVADLERELYFYQEMIGLKIQSQEGAYADLGAGGELLLRLTEVPNARRLRGTSGLYHFAILLPSRRELARVVRRLFDRQYRNYPTDHIMTKTTYLDDPEGNTIELYADTPEDGWMGTIDGLFQARRSNGSLSDGREALDVAALFRELKPDDRIEAPMPSETRLGHYHLYVADLEATRQFYHGKLGFDDMGLSQAAKMGMVSAGGYHHHIGYNTWMGTGAPPAPTGALGMRYFTFILPNQADLEHGLERARQVGLEPEENEAGWALRDPSGNTIVLSVA